jgi:hypothetical protein
MSRPILCLWLYLANALLVFAVLPVFLYLLRFSPYSPRGHRSYFQSFDPLTLFFDCADLRFALLIGVFYFAYSRQWYRQNWRLMKKVRWFRTVKEREIVLHYAPELAGQWDLAVLLQRCQAELDHVANRLRVRRRSRVVVFLFSTHREISGIFGPQCAGTALSLANAIIVACDTNLQEYMRHELAHLFSWHWNRSAPPLLSEGLSVWAQDTIQSDPIDIAARPLLRDRSLTLPRLLKRKFFYAEPHIHACYTLAGSFTGFLIRRYGWKPYRKLYWLCDGFRFGAKFKKCVGGKPGRGGSAVAERDHADGSLQSPAAREWGAVSR